MIIFLLSLQPQDKVSSYLIGTFLINYFHNSHPLHAYIQYRKYLSSRIFPCTDKYSHQQNRVSFWHTHFAIIPLYGHGFRQWRARFALHPPPIKHNLLAWWPSEARRLLYPMVNFPLRKVTFYYVFQNNKGRHSSKRINWNNNLHNSILTLSHNLWRKET